MFRSVIQKLDFQLCNFQVAIKNQGPACGIPDVLRGVVRMERIRRRDKKTAPHYSPEAYT